MLLNVSTFFRIRQNAPRHFDGERWCGAPLDIARCIAALHDGHRSRAAAAREDKDGHSTLAWVMAAIAVLFIVIHIKWL